MNHIRLAPFILAASLFSFATPVFGVAVELNIVPSARAPFNASQQWALELAKLKSVQVRADGRTAARPEVKRSGSIVEITGVIDSRNQLIVPGSSFSIRQRPALQKWIDQQRSGVSNASARSRDRFGLTTDQLQQTHESLKATLVGSTKGKSVQTVVQGAARSAGLRIQFSSTAKQRISGAKVDEEWQGFTAGTSIAAALRPLELVVAPKVEGGRIGLAVSTDTDVPEGWPVGWKSKLKTSELVPKFYDPLPIDVESTPVGDVMTALEARLATPMFYDSALLDLLDIDPSSKKVSYKAERSTYLKVVKTCLYKAGMKYELRVDELGKPFFWLSPRKIPKAR